MPSYHTRARRPESWLRRFSDEVYFGVLALAAVVIVAVLVVGGVSYLIDFTSWVALND